MKSPAYQPLEEICRNSLHVVHRVTDTRGERFLLKSARPGNPEDHASEKLKKEYKLLKDAAVVGVPVYLEMLDLRSGPALLLADINGLPLSQYLQTKTLSLPDVLRLSLKLVEALASLHRLHLTHGAVSPHNILLDQANDETYLVNHDLSVASEQSAQVFSSRLIDDLRYIAPEQSGRINRPTDYRADFYSLGATMYEMLTGSCLFTADDTLELIHSHIARQPRSPAELRAGIPRVVSDIVMRLLAKNPDERYQSAAGLRVDLQKCLDDYTNDRELEQFELATRDIPDRFIVPQTLYGRDSEVRVLVDGFEEACNGSAAMSVVSGPPGIGKTSLIQELRKPIIRQRAYVGTGKCDHALREVPFGVLLQALRTIAQQLITESEARIANWRTRFLDLLGPNAGLITQVIPEIEKIVGRQTIPSVLAATEAQNRFQLVLQQFIKCIAHHDHPVVLILEDLQWSDAASLTAIQRLVAEPDIRFLYLIGSHRDTEVDDTHGLTSVLANIASSGKLRQVQLAPLTLNGVTDLVQAIIHGERETAESLAKIVLEKTAGNPFFVTEFMKHLHDESLLSFDHQSLSWSFELERIIKSDVTENVIALMVRKIEKLNPKTQESLKRAALIGNSFELDVLALATEQSIDEVRDALDTAIREGLLVVHSSAYSHADDLSASVTIYRFAHDELHRACLNMMQPEDRAAIHLAIGRLMRDTWGLQAADGRVFEVVHQLNLGRHLISSDSERLKLIRLNLIAGRKAKTSTAFHTALEYFTLGHNALAPGDWQTDYELCFEVNLEAAECSYLCGDFSAAETLLEALLDRAQNSADKARVHSLRVVEYENMIRYSDALESGRRALALFGFLLADSTQKTQAALEVEIESINALLGERAIESLIESKQINDPEIRMVMNLLTAMWPSAYLTGDIVLTRLLSAIMVRLSLVYGHCEESAYGYVTHAITVGPVRGDYKSAYEFGKLALRVNEQFQDSKRRAKIYQQFQAHVNLWRRPLQTCISYAQEARRAGLETGDFTYANYGAFTESWPALLSTNNLPQFVVDYSENYEFIKKLKFTNFADAQLLLLNSCRALIGDTPQPVSLSTESFDELEYAHKYRGNPFFMNFYHLSKLQLGFHFGKHEEALEHASNAEWIVPPLVGTVWPAVWAFWRGLILAVTCTPAKAPQHVVEELERQQSYLARLADNCAENFRCHALLLSAEIERIAGRTLAASDLYEQAISFARETNSLQNLALANERYAAFWQARQHAAVAAGFQQEAVEAYAALGARAKADYLRELYERGSGSSVFNAPANRAADSSPHVDLDIATALKAAGAISGEIDLNRLLARLVSIVIENAGAERGSLILEKNGEPFIRSEGSSENVEVTRDTALPLEDATHLPRSIVHYVRRTHETVVLNEAASDDRFAADSYIREHQPRAIMCIPIMKQAELIGVMYLENNLTANAFTPDRTQLVELLASEAAISLENATLYEEMKREILQRKLAEETLRSITEGTASVTGADFFYSLVRHLASALRVKYAFVTKCVGSDRSRVRTLAFWNGEGFAQNIEYELEPTPCCNVIAGETCHYPDSLQQLFPRDTELATINAQSFFGVPLVNSTGQVLGHLAAIDDKPMPENPKEFPILKIFAARAGAELERLQADEELKSALAEVEALKNRLQAENIYLQEELSQEHPFKEIVGNSPPLLRMLADVERIAATSATVLIIGETGTGKELLARAIHNGSNRKERALVKVNCGAISAGLVESELFGHVKGAFTGAISNRVGRFELADGGTLFLDEISELPLETQVKLLRVLQEGEFEPVGSSRTVRVDVRIIAASNRNLEDEIKAGRFRADLFYRLNVLPLKVPSLRERASDIPQLVMFFVSKFSKKFGKNVQVVSQDTMRLLTRYSWPGNIRELQNIIERAVVLAGGTQLQIGEETFPGPSPNGSPINPIPVEPVSESPAATGSLQDIERAHIVSVLDQVNWVIEGPRGAARILNLHPNTLRSRMKKLSIRRAHDIS